MNAAYKGPDYSPVNMRESLSSEQSEVVESFLKSLVQYRSKFNVSVSKYMRIYRKDRNGSYFFKKCKGTTS
ncbi:hypothetical protein Ga0466249_002783 [Sporomusaceae bacterium BoRhaA]|nr:hypothetical protein [Pelorhabdus rhamnosifermentans]